MRILHLGTDNFGGYGGIALYNRDLIAALATHPDVSEVVVIPRIIVGEIEPIPPQVTFASEAARGRFAFMRAIRAAARGPRFDLVICAHTNLIPLARLVSGRPLLIIYGIEAWKPLRDPLSNRLLPSLRGVVSISQITLDRFAGWSDYDGATFILPNSIRIEQYGIRPKSETLIRRYGLDGKRVLLTLGRVATSEQYKGFDEVLEVLPELDADVVYVIAGSGDGVPALQRKAAALGLTGRVVFTGMVPEREKADLYSVATLYVMPSRGEGFGFAFLEAMASGIPVIGSRLDGGREALRSGALGLLVDPTNPGEIRTAITDALAQVERRIPEGLDFFSFGNFERRTHALVDELTANRVTMTR